MLIQHYEVTHIPINFVFSRESLPATVPYYCMRCKSYIFSVNREVVTVWMGEGFPEREIPNDMGWIRFFCQGCKRNYNFYLN